MLLLAQTLLQQQGNPNTSAAGGKPSRSTGPPLSHVRLISYDSRDKYSTGHEITPFSSR
jgi:hypothetical protein